MMFWKCLEMERKWYFDSYFILHFISSEAQLCLTSLHSCEGNSCPALSTEFTVQIWPFSSVLTFQKKYSINFLGKLFLTDVYFCCGTQTDKNLCSCGISGVNERYISDHSLPAGQCGVLCISSAIQYMFLF